jgi:hypothetical protein
VTIGKMPPIENATNEETAAVHGEGWWSALNLRPARSSDHRPQ